MRLLLDAHTLIWAADQPSNLGSNAFAALQDPNNVLLLSAGSIWEIGKTGLKKLTLSQPFRAWMEKAMADLGVVVLPITVESAHVQAGLPTHHRDPFDRLLVAESRIQAIPLVSADTILDQYGVVRIW